MAVVLVVTRSPNLALALGGSGSAHDVIEVRPPGLAAWLSGPARPTPAVVVIAQPWPEDALATLFRLRDAGVSAPALILSGDGDAWAALEDTAPGGDPASRLLPLPVTGPDLVAAVEGALGAPSAPTAVAPTRLAGPAAAPSRPADEPSEADEAPAPVPPAGHVIDLRGGEAEQARAADVRAAVRRLLEQVDEVYGVPESAAVVLAEARARVGADAAVLLVADGERWRPAAVEGLTDEERVDVLPPSSWVASTIGSARRGLVVEDTDLARERLDGVGLGARRHVLVAPMAPSGAVVVLAREDPAFTDGEVSSLVDLAEEAGPLLVAAQDARSLARALAPLRDVEALPERVSG
ncbi:MAG TPA: hypothetical protein VMI11_12165 [Actinomycetes bacterium]|nr:hypothetical protein [Actinomycetes bacterium]